MGSSASKANAGNSANKRSSVQSRVAKSRALAGADNETDEFHNACMVVFENADADKNGALDQDEFWSVLQSPTLNLNLSEDEMREIQGMSDKDADGTISYREFIPVVKKLLQKVYENKATDWNDWCKLTDPENGKVMYMNKRTGVVQSQKPDNYHEGRVEEAQFETIILADGTEVTTYMENGQRMYMNWDEDKWEPFPEEWEQEQGIDSEHDPRVGEYDHPKKGKLPTYLFENTRNTRLYYDESSGQWARMPLSWECNVKDVKQSLQELDRHFPQWKNVNEQLLVLRECNYDIQDAIIFADINWHFDGKSKETQSRGGFGRTQTGDDTGSGGMDVNAATLIHDLQVQVTQLTDELNKVKTESEEDKHEEVKQITRAKTQVENLMKRKERTAKEAEERILELSKENMDFREQIAELNKDLVEAKADKEKLTMLEKESATLASSSGNDKAAVALKEKSALLEQVRMENVALKLKMQSAKQKMDDPSKNKGTIKLVRDLHRRVTELQREKNEASKELNTDVAALTEMFKNALTYSKTLADNVKTQVEEITAKYRKEQIQRKLLYNKVQELRGNIRVFCRTRFDKRTPCCLKYPSSTELMAPTLTGGIETTEWDNVYSPEASQEKVFEDTKPIIMSCVDGYNVCIMAYGQTGSGKTYTMMGPEDNPGVNRRAIRELIQLVENTSEVEYNITVSLLEVYNEKVYDLLVSDRSKTLSIHQDVERGVFVQGLTDQPVKTVEDVEKVMKTGDKNRSTESTKMNTDSSRSHLILQIKVQGYNTISNVRTLGKLTLVDLAGSERQSKTQASGARLVEAAAINKSLSALGQVFSALSKNSPHIPYRNSKLTHILQDSLGGDSKTAVFINLSPSESNLAETHCTLNFGKNIRKIELGPATKHKAPPKPRKR